MLLVASTCFVILPFPEEECMSTSACDLQVCF
jgi:hypothetical protein